MNETIVFFMKLNKLLSVCGLPNLWVNKMYDKKIFEYFHKVITLFLIGFLGMELGSYITQPYLSDKQSTDRFLFCLSHPILFCYYIYLEYQKSTVKSILIEMWISLKKVYNDPNVETHMIKKVSFYSIVYMMTMSLTLISYGLDGLMQVIRSGGSFTTVVTAWPKVDDNSALAYIGGVVNYIIWWAFMLRVTGVIILIVTVTVSLSHQYRNVQSYFSSLNEIFHNNGDSKSRVKQPEMELIYLKALKVGIKLHADTMWCTRQCQKACSKIFSGQILINFAVFSVLMLQMVNSERTLSNTLAIVVTAGTLLTSTGILMWNAGDVTVEAALVPNAIFSSGWQNCRGKMSSKVKKLLVIAMMQGQRHVVLRSFGVLEISYQSYLSIVKASYSVFSLLY